VNCNEVQRLIDAYVDGELDLVNSLAVERHVQDCANCRAIYKNRTAIRAAVRVGSLYFAAPPNLDRRIQTLVRRANNIYVIPPGVRRLSIAAALIVGLLLTMALARGMFNPAADDPITQEVIASHVRSLMANHLADVASSDQHTVKPWFNGKLNFSPVVVDPTSQGYPLVGGRLDYLDNRSVAALVYHRQQHVINVFIWPSADAGDGTTTTSTRQGYHLFHWNQAGMTYWAISDLNTGEMQEFVQIVQSQTALAASP
jgi:anti-sigma factor RsiW